MRLVGRGVSTSHTEIAPNRVQATGIVDWPTSRAHEARVYIESMRSQPDSATLDGLLDAEVRRLIERRFWEPVEASACIEVLRHDEIFLSNPTAHPSMFADHGVVHVRDIAASFIELGSTVNGRLLADRPADRQTFLLAYGLLITYLHDTGMFDQTRAGRRVHALFGAQLAFSTAMDDVIDLLVEGSGPVVDRLRKVEADSPFVAPLDVVLREVMSLTAAHSKSTVPAAVLNDRAGFRRLMMRSVFTDLEAHKASGHTPDGAVGPIELSVNLDRYDDPMSEAFAWLVSGDVEHQRLVDDVIDAVRVLRAADALRQRGTSLRTAAGYEMFIAAATGSAVYALRNAANTELVLMRSDDEKSSGEANVRVAAVTQNGHLRISFHRGGFTDAGACERAAHATAVVVGDIQADVLPTFSAARHATDLPLPTRRATDMVVQLERPADRPAFADDVAAHLISMYPDLRGRVAVVADVEGAAPTERERYHRSLPVAPGSARADEIIAGLGAHGLRVGAVDAVAAFEDVRVAQLEAGEVLAAAGSPSAFVYAATAPGLVVRPLGGYATQPVGAWVPIGVTGVIRRAGRNSDVVAEQAVEVVLIPGELYTREWFRPYEPHEIADVLRGKQP